MIDPIEIRGHLIVVRITGSLTRVDYDRFVPWLEHRVAMSSQPLRFVVHAEEWNDWADLREAWADLKMDSHFIGQMDRLAMVGDSRWQEWMTNLGSPLVPTNLRWFDLGEADAAKAWAMGREGAA